MKGRIVRTLALAVCALGAPAFLLAADDAPGAAESGWAESVVVERVFWPLRFESARNLEPRADDCVAIGLDDIRVLEDGQEVPATHLERASIPTIHAILFDTSRSMSPLLEQAQEAARAYVQETVPDEPVMLATFDDSLILRTPLTRDLARLERSIDTLDLGYGTDLWGSVYHLVRFLEPLPGRKVIVLLSDGLDTHSYRSDAFETARWFAGTTPNLTVYPVGLQIPDESGYVAPISRTSLDVLARVTGGRLLVARTPRELDTHFGTIRELLDRELFVTYIPPPFGEGAKDRPDRQSFKLRKVKVRVAMRTRCRLAPGVPDERFVGRRSDTVDALRPVVAGEDAPAATGGDAAVATHGGEPAPLSASGTCLPLDDETRTVATFALPSGYMPTLPGEHSGTLARTDDPRFLLGRVVDIVRETGQLYDGETLRTSGAFVVGDLSRPVGAERDIAVETLPAAATRERLADPLDVLLRLLRDSGCRDPARRSPLVVNGQTFLHLRRYIGQALFEGRDDLRAFAVEHLRREIEPAARALLSDLEATGVDEARREAVAAALRGRAERPEAGQPQRLLADWLGDVPVASLARRMQAGAIERLLEGVESGPLSPGEVERLWPLLRARFPLPVDERVRVPLILAWDADRGRFGFYRFLLPRFRPDAPPRDELAPDPLALRTARRLLSDAEGLSAGALRLAGPDAVRETSLAGPDLVRVAALVPGAERTAAADASRALHAIAVDLSFAVSSPGKGPVTVREIWARPVHGALESPAPLAPVCRDVSIPSELARSEAFAPLAAAARDAGKLPACPALR